MKIGFAFLILLQYFLKPAKCCGNPEIKPIVYYTIVGGVEAKPHSWPWQVSLMSALKTPLCGGSLINSQWVLSAAHCYHLGNHMPKPAVVRVGEHDLTPNVIEPNQKDFIITKPIFHPKYDDDTINNDIVLLKLDAPVTFNSHVQPICLPEKGAELHNGEVCYVAGWGDTLLENKKKRDASLILLQVALPVLSDQICKSFKAIANDMTEFMMCAGFQHGGKDSCQGDSGGPLVCQNNNGQWVQHGIVSWGNHCALPNSPGLYTKVTKYLDWIAETIAEN